MVGTVLEREGTRPSRTGRSCVSPFAAGVSVSAPRCSVRDKIRLSAGRAEFPVSPQPAARILSPGVGCLEYVCITTGPTARSQHRPRRGDVPLIPSTETCRHTCVGCQAVGRLQRGEGRSSVGRAGSNPPSPPRSWQPLRPRAPGITRTRHDVVRPAGHLEQQRLTGPAITFSEQTTAARTHRRSVDRSMFIGCERP
jgi:hypothetical protein